MMDYKIVPSHPGGVAMISSRPMLQTPETSVKSYGTLPLGFKGVPFFVAARFVLRFSLEPAEIAMLIR